MALTWLFPTNPLAYPNPGFHTVEASGATVATRSLAPNCTQSWRQRCGLGGDAKVASMLLPKVSTINIHQPLESNKYGIIWNNGY